MSVANPPLSLCLSKRLCSLWCDLGWTTWLDPRFTCAVPRRSLLIFLLNRSLCAVITVRALASSDSSDPRATQLCRERCEIWATAEPSGHKWRISFLSLICLPLLFLRRLLLHRSHIAIDRILQLTGTVVNLASPPSILHRTCSLCDPQLRRNEAHSATNGWHADGHHLHGGPVPTRGASTGQLRVHKHRVWHDITRRAPYVPKLIGRVLHGWAVPRGAWILQKWEWGSYAGCRVEIPRLAAASNLTFCFTTYTCTCNRLKLLGDSFVVFPFHKKRYPTF